MLHFSSITKCLQLVRVLQSLRYLASSHAGRYGSRITNHPLNLILSSWGTDPTQQTQHVNGSTEPVPVPGKITRSTHLPDHESGISILWLSPFLLWPVHTEHTTEATATEVFQSKLPPLGFILSNIINSLLFESILFRLFTMTLSLQCKTTHCHTTEKSPEFQFGWFDHNQT